MTARPDFDFQLGRAIRLRGWGHSGLLALVILLLTAVVIGPAIAELPELVSRLTVALKSLY
jgi:hypothetical protein